MKSTPKALRPLATATLLATLALGAQAQSSVNVYGLMDLSVGSTQAPGGTATTAVDSGKMTTSYYGFGGREDLGGGLAATFRIEGFLRAASGDAGRFNGDPQFSRTASVGLGSARLGSLTLGRNTTALFVSTLGFNAFGDSFGYSPSIRHYFTSGTTTGDSGWSDSIAYNSPTWDGFKAGAMVTSKTGNGGNWSVNLGYGAGPLAVSLVHQQVKKDGAAAVADTDTTQLGASYDFGVAKAFLQLGQVDNTTTSNDHKITGLGARVPLGAGAVIAQYGQISPQTGADRNTLSVGYLHNLSKRTELYAVAMHDKIDGLPSGGGYSLGVRHRF
jgi:predicted porin